MSTDQSIAHRGFRLLAYLFLAVLTGGGVMIPQAAALLGCSHPYCSTPAASHMHPEPVRIDSASHPSCCAQQTSGDCRLCQFEDFSMPEIACHTGQSGNHQSATSISTVRQSLLPFAAVRSDGSRIICAADKHAPPLYLQTLTLLI